MYNVYFPTVFDFGADVPWAVRYDVWQKFLFDNPNDWFLVHREDNKGRIVDICRKLRNRGCLSAVHRYSDGSHAVYGAYWRFDNEDS